MIKRMITAACALVASVALFACQSGTSTPTTLSAWAQDASLFSNGVAAAVPQVANITGIPATQAALIQQSLTQAAQFAGQLATITDPASAASTLSKVEAALNAALAAIAPFSALLPPPFGIVLSAAQVLLPVLEAVITPATAHRPTAAQQSMSPDTARLVLRGAAARRSN